MGGEGRYRISFRDYYDKLLILKIIARAIRAYGNYLPQIQAVAASITATP